MAHEQQHVLCFQCGKSVGEPPVLNHLPDGGNCPRCADRVLEALPAILPAEVRSIVPQGEASER